MTNISVNYMGLILNSPVIAASSGLTTQLDKIESFERAGVGAIVVKSLFEEQIVDEADFLNSRSNDYPESADYLHHYMRQYSIEKYLNLLREIKAKVSIPVIASINCYSKGEWVSYAREIEKTGVNAIELNIYSLPLNIHKSSTDVEKDYLDVIGTVTKMLKIPVAVKIAGYVTNLPGFVNNLKAYGAKGVVMFNRFYTPDIDITKLKIVAAEAFSTETESLRELRWMGIVSALVPGIDLSSSTGIHTGETAIKQILAGATTVQMCTALYKRGAEAISDVNQDIHIFMEKHGFKTLKDFKGILNYSNIEDPRKFERVQFMKNFGGK